MAILINSTSSFYATKNEAVFKTFASKFRLREASEFSQDSISSYKKDDNIVKFFSDEKEISVRLNDESLELLRKNFAEHNFLNLKDGSIALSSAAASFVEAWYKDIMQNRNFLDADLNKDKKIDGKEFLLLKNSVKDKTNNQNLLDKMEILVLREAVSTQGYMQSKMEQNPLSLDSLLNEAIKSDKNFDLKISRLEYSAKGGSDLEGYTRWAKEAVDEILSEEQKKKSIKLVIDPDDKIFSNFNGFSTQSIKDYFENPFKKFGIQSIDIINLSKAKLRLKDKELDEDLQRLLKEFPHLKALIENNPNISKESLEKIEKQNKMLTVYKENEKENLSLKFSKSIFKKDILA